MNQVDMFFNKKYTYAIVGATDNKNKYGYKIFKTLVDSGFKVIPINLKLKQIEGITCYPSLESVPQKIDIVDFVIPKSITEKIIKTLPALKINKVWFQPETYTNEILWYCNDNKIEYIKDFCLLKETLERKQEPTLNPKSF